MYSTNIYELASDLVAIAKSRGVMLATAESCTGGLLSGAITSVSGSSVVFDRGFITYSNKAKIELLGVNSVIIDEKGAVSKEVAQAMSEGALANSDADVSISITGIAGPGGGSESKPVGLVWVSIKLHEQVRSYKNIFLGERQDIRMQTVEFCLKELIKLLSLNS